MKKSPAQSKKQKQYIGLIVFLSFLAVVLTYFIVCCGVTFIPMLQMLKVNQTACRFPGGDGKPEEVFTFDSGARLSYFPGDTTIKNKYVVICPGGGYVVCSVETEGYPIAQEFNRLGYRAFVLEYRIGGASDSFHAPLDDLAEAIRFIDNNADRFCVQAGLYTLCGFSAGGNLVGMFGTEEYGYSNYEGVKRPNSLILGYPWISPTDRVTGNAVEAIYRATINHNGATCFLGEDYAIRDMCVDVWVTPIYPRTYIMQGDKDAVLPVEDNGDLMAQVLEENEVEFVYERCSGVNHGCGLGIGTTAEGWIERAVEFDEKYWYEEEFTPEPIDCEELVSRAGGLICGVCHPDNKGEEVLELGADWVRVDISWPAYNTDGSANIYYEWIKGQMINYANQGLKVFAVTPYPKSYQEWGYDPLTPEGRLEITKMARFYVEDLRGIVSAFQVTNEMTEPQFRAPLSDRQAVEFIGMQLQAMYRYRGNILIGYNMSATDINFASKMSEYNDYCDYIGIDLYLGCFESMTRYFGFATGTAWVKLAWSQAHRPIIFTEFGYLSAGERMSDENKLALLHKYGAVGDTVAEAEAYAKAHIIDFINDADFPAALRERLYLLCADDEEALANTLFGGSGWSSISYAAHLYMELEDGVYIDGYPHTPEGQADYFTAFFDNIIIPNEMVCGAIMYCFNDSARCYVCGQEHCPVETGWGLLDGKGEKKPAFDAVKDAFAKWKETYAQKQEEEQ